MIRGQSLEQVIGDMRMPAPVLVTPVALVTVGEKHDERVRMLDGMVKRLRGYVAELQEEIKGKDYEIHRLSRQAAQGPHCHATRNWQRMRKW